MRRMPIEIIYDLKGNSEPKAEHNNEQHSELVVEISLLGEHEIARTKQDVLGVEDHVVDEVAETSRTGLEVKVDENVDERADEVVELLEDLLARVVHLLTRYAVVGLETQYPKVHDEPVREYDHEEPRAEGRGEYGHGEDPWCD